MTAGKQIEEAKGRLTGSIHQAIYKFREKTGLMPSGISVKIIETTMALERSEGHRNFQIGRIDIDISL